MQVFLTVCFVCCISDKNSIEGSLEHMLTGRMATPLSSTLSLSSVALLVQHLFDAFMNKAQHLKYGDHGVPWILQINLYVAAQSSQDAKDQILECYTKFTLSD